MRLRVVARLKLETLFAEFASSAVAVALPEPS
jgi:hypothetical protein